MDKWEWDRQHIKEHREKVEPYSGFEKMMISLFNEPLSVTLKTWPNRFNKDNTCKECDEGKIERNETILSSGLKVVTLECSNPDCPFFEKYLFTPEGEALDFEHKPEVKMGQGQRKLADEEKKQFELKSREIEKLWRKEKKG